MKKPSVKQATKLVILLCLALSSCEESNKHHENLLLGVEFKNGSLEPWQYTRSNTPRRVYNYYLKDGVIVFHGPSYTFGEGEVNFSVYKDGVMIESNTWLPTGHDLKK